MHPSVVKEPERRSKTPIAPPGVMRAGGAISHPLRETDVDLGPHGPGSFPPACTLLSRTYHEPHPPSSSRSKPLGRPPIPVTFPPTSSIRWNRNATPPRLGATAGHTPRRSAATAAANAAARLRPVRRDGDSTLAFIYRRFSLDSSWSNARNAKSRVSVVSHSEHLALLRWSSGELLQRNHRTEDLRDATPGQAADSLANAADLRKSTVRSTSVSTSRHARHPLQEAGRSNPRPFPWR
jgi:hypothetical protein